MAYWFHRNVFKSTAIVNFETKLVGEDVEARKICNDVHASRQRLLALLPDANHDSETVSKALDVYLSVLGGFLCEPGTGPILNGAPSKLRHSYSFRWTHSLLGNTPQVSGDAMFEVCSACWNVGIWYMKHAAMLAGKDDVSLEGAKEVHSSLRAAAGLFSLVQSRLAAELTERHVDGSDLDPRVMTAYVKQCTAEAQEVTLARAVELKHNAALVSALANETARLFADAEAALTNLEPAVQWRKYLQLKHAFYLAYAHNFCGENLLAQDKCGEAIRSLRESNVCLQRAETLCKEYGKAKGPAPKARPERHPFFRRLAPMLKLTLDKCERENGFIYHQAVPADPPALELKATFGLVSPLDHQLPQLSALWTPVSYAALDPQPVGNTATQGKVKDLPPVQETQVHQSSIEPKTSSGCSLQ